MDTLLLFIYLFSFCAIYFAAALLLPKIFVGLETVLAAFILDEFWKFCFCIFYHFVLKFDCGFFTSFTEFSCSLSSEENSSLKLSGMPPEHGAMIDFFSLVLLDSL
jgi:hypothetical protein